MLSDARQNALSFARERAINIERRRQAAFDEPDRWKHDFFHTIVQRPDYKPPPWMKPLPIPPTVSSSSSDESEDEKEKKRKKKKKECHHCRLGLCRLCCHRLGDNSVCSEKLIKAGFGLCKTKTVVLKALL